MTRLNHLLYHVAEVIYLIRPTNVLPCLLQLSLTSHMIRMMEQHQEYRLHQFFSEPASWGSSGSPKRASYRKRTDFITLRNTFTARFASFDRSIVCAGYVTHDTSSCFSTALHKLNLTWLFKNAVVCLDVTESWILNPSYVEHWY